MKILNLSVLWLPILILFSGIARAQNGSTTIIVRAKAKDAKFIGDGMGGAMITIINASTGDTLARGLTKGGTGDTQRLIKKPIKRYEKLSTPDAAKFETSLSLQQPTLVTIKATANYGKTDAQITSSTQKWLIPGKNITGDGIILEIPGFVVHNQQPESVGVYTTGQSIPIRSHIVMMCGCPVSKGGLWDSSNYQIEAHISRGGKLINKIPLSFSNKSSFFETSFVPDKPGKYQIIVIVFDSETGNTGVAKTEIKVS